MEGIVTDPFHARSDHDVWRSNVIVAAKFVCVFTVLAGIEEKCWKPQKGTGYMTCDMVDVTAARFYVKIK